MSAQSRSPRAKGDGAAAAAQLVGEASAAATGLTDRSSRCQKKEAGLIRISAGVIAIGCIGHMKLRRDSAEADGDIVLDVADVRPDSRVGDLTVAQLAQILIQVIAQSGRNRRQTPEEFALVAKQMEALLTGKADRNPLVQMSKDAQLAVIRRMPDLVRQLDSATKEPARKARK